LIKDEEARRVKLRGMLLGDEATSLKEQLAKRDSRLKELVDAVEDTRIQLEGAQERCRRQDMLVASQARQIANLKVLSHCQY
jgi:21S rRNA (uridine2791-2'-O)-methyltransferase